MIEYEEYVVDVGRRPSRQSTKTLVYSTRNFKKLVKIESCGKTLVYSTRNFKKLVKNESCGKTLVYSTRNFKKT